MPSVHYAVKEICEIAFAAFPFSGEASKTEDGEYAYFAQCISYT